jgi:hypothetical protein
MLLEGLAQLNENLNYLTGTRTRYLPACSIVPQNRRGEYKAQRPGLLSVGPHKTRIESIHFIKVFASLKLLELFIKKISKNKLKISAMS